ncbi:hypothetical protein EFT87_05535 [Schleiferilactobacillus harbinensis]|uniref:hypothetical protein n=2 Tax=Schleiferilactobacillus harbinensis TaxID=304207 RepID=UPI0021A599C1|nr:hypothetical protein [Schleiferilactobacillus harbinensis]MCT2908120.1 hypothetical protein [Schleiferilactobacillus harbinensis]
MSPREIAILRYLAGVFVGFVFFILMGYAGWQLLQSTAIVAFSVAVAALIPNLFKLRKKQPAA